MPQHASCNNQRDEFGIRPVFLLSFYNDTLQEIKDLAI